MEEKKCEKCESNDVLEIIYGLVEESSISGEKADNLYFAGCEVPSEPKFWHCNKCGYEWGKQRL